MLLLFVLFLSACTNILASMSDSVDGLCLGKIRELLCSRIVYVQGFFKVDGSIHHAIGGSVSHSPVV